MNRKELLVIARSTLREYNKDDVGLLAAGMTYYSFFSLFPLLLLIVTVASLILTREQAVELIFNNIARVTPGAASSQMLQDIVTKAFENRKNAGLIFVIGLGTLAFSASNAFGTLDKAINRAWNTEKIPNFIIAKLVSFAMMLGVVALLVLSLAVSIALNTTRTFTSSVVGNLPGSQLFWSLVDFGVSLALVFLVFLLMYRFLPRCAVGLRDVWPGALLAAVAWVVVKNGFALFLSSSFGSYDAVYGTMGTVIGLLTWIYISSVIILFGAEFASETNHIRAAREQIIGGAAARQQNEGKSASPWFPDAPGQ